jgi:hypothetical protein
LRKEIENGIITEDVMEILSKVCTKKELGEFRKLEIVSATYFLKEDQCETLPEWCDKVIADRGKIYTKDGHVCDSRTYAWYAVPMKDIVDTTINLRSQWKKKKSEADSIGDKQAKFRADGKQKFLKLFNNTIYGVIASPFFAIGNSLLANNITAYIRCISWCMAKALGGLQVVTDGCAYSPSRVTSIPTKFYGIKTLSNYDLMLDSKFAKQVNMEDYPWKKSFSAMPEMSNDEFKAEVEFADLCAKEHVEKFFGFWGVSKLFEGFKIEHKPDNTADVWAYFGKSDYAYRKVIDGSIGFKIRGAKDHVARGTAARRSQKYQLLLNIIEGDEYIPRGTWDFTGIMSVSFWQHIQRHQGFESIRHVKPGEDYVLERNFRIRNTHVPHYTQKDWLRRKKAGINGEVLYEDSQTIMTCVIRMMGDMLKKQVSKSVNAKPAIMEELYKLGEEVESEYALH